MAEFIGNSVDVSQSESGYLEHPTEGIDMAKDGSTTPIVYRVDIPDDGRDYAFTGLGMTFNSNSGIDSGQSFMDFGAPLANGITYGFILRSDDVTQVPVRGPIKTNMDIFSRDSQASQYNMSGNDEVVTFDVAAGFPLTVSANLASAIYVQIADDLTDLKAAQAYVKLYRVITSRR